MSNNNHSCSFKTAIIKSFLEKQIIKDSHTIPLISQRGEQLHTWNFIKLKIYN